MADKEICKTDGCKNETVAHGLCRDCIAKAFAQVYRPATSEGDDSS